MTTEGIVHKPIGRARQPVVLLHGWLNSWDVWRNTMLAISDEKRYRVYALDF